MLLTICDLNPAVPVAVADAAARRGLTTVSAHIGDLLALQADAAVSPANSFGMMDGGIDLSFSQKWGWGVQEHLRALIAARPMEELLVGEALIVPTGDLDIRFCISAPTMRVPGPIHDPADVFLASKAAFLAARAAKFERLLMPGMGTLTGRVPAALAAKLMLDAYQAVFRL
ncbi:O-acetyl-ADP-ribose deacetylase (regulator of RNase III) [Methylobacterium sp. RAS18]|nr:O-acetyl-ADP-ribose deacetylase (regulator of RNase III) [Methylobacterium sp. RAS18]